MTEHLQLAAPADGALANPDPIAEVFTFGDPESVLDRGEIFDLFETVQNGRWYEPPISQAGLARAYRMTSHHQSAIVLKRNLLVRAFKPSDLLSTTAFSRWVLDWLLMGNAYMEAQRNLAGDVVRLIPAPAVYTRRGVEAGQFFFVRSQFLQNKAHEFARGAVHHLIEPDPMQEIYGMPEYLSAMQSGLLNEAATLFRRRYYRNGSHAGFILYISEEGLGTVDSDAIRKAMKDAKGPGNFRNLYLHIPKGKKDGVQILPISEVAAKDDFLNIKDTTRDDVLAAHRVPPQLLGIVPKNAGGFGNVVDAARTFYELEIEPIQQRLCELNEFLGFEAIAFTPREGLAMLTSQAPAD
ncbi:phage portal protein [Croceicoccus sp. BE223]|uniref:phage portal protein n=1 Tax=Croceicoccus sp. BE223 TaxID=2817716 RepID=UPI00285F1727|nr:phage portal protein [Croceicoccus sp. BE223]MDR7101479.1 PBSX family phage portal protein [Croceicoccus sp. BE223]